MNRPLDTLPTLVETRIFAIERENLTQLLLSAQEEERQRIAADLHDEIGQCLSAVQFAFGALRQQLKERMTDAEKEMCSALSERVARAIEEVRRVCMGLRPPMLDDLGIVSAIEWYCSELRKVLADVDMTQTLHADEGAISPPVKIAIFRILQEACANACKHAQANRLSVRLDTDTEGIRLEVSDDGIGFDPATARRFCRGFGLASMRERAVMTGGRWTLKSQTGKGTQVIASWRAKRPTDQKPPPAALQSTNEQLGPSRPQSIQVAS